MWKDPSWYVGHCISGSEWLDLAKRSVESGISNRKLKDHLCVKVRVCPEHAQQLNYRKNQEALRAQQKSQKRQERREDAADGSARGAKRRRDNATEKSLLEQVSMQAGDASDSQAAGQTRQGADAGALLSRGLSTPADCIPNHGRGALS